MNETNASAFETVMAEGDLFVMKDRPLTVFAAIEQIVGDETYTRYYELFVDEAITHVFL